MNWHVSYVIIQPRLLLINTVCNPPFQTKIPNEAQRMSSRSTSLARRLLLSSQRRSQSSYRAHYDLLLASRRQPQPKAASFSSLAIRRRTAAAPVAVAIRRHSNSQRPATSSNAVAGTAQSGVAGKQDDHLAVAKPLDFDMASQVDGQESQMVTFELEPGQVIRVS